MFSKLFSLAVSFFIAVILLTSFFDKAECLTIFSAEDGKATGRHDFKLNSDFEKQLNWLKDQLSAARKLWEEGKLDNYILTVTVESFSPFHGNSFVTVKDKRIVQVGGDAEIVEQIRSGKKSISEYNWVLVPALFERIESNLSSVEEQAKKWVNSDQKFKNNVLDSELIYKDIVFNYDKKYGYPRYIDTTYFAEDADLVINIELLE